MAFLLLCGMTAQAKDYYFTPRQKDTLKELLAGGSLRPGDQVILKDGVYEDLGDLHFFAEGTVTDSIKLRAEHSGKVIVKGYLDMKIYGQYLQVEGLFFHQAWPKGFSMIEFRKENGVNASHCRLTDCVIDDCNSPNRNEAPPKAGQQPKDVSEYWVGLYGTNHRVDHCYFANKRIGGLVVQVWLDEKCHVNNHLIDHNLFGFRQPYGGNGAEIIRIGHSWSSQLESHTVVENNVFLQCNGENEIISVKSCHNILRRNLFFESKGGLVCRHGHYNVLESNTLIGNGIPATCGIRIINQGHTVYDNMVCRVDSWGLLVRMGVFEKPTAETDIKKEPLTSYHRAENVNIAYNRFIDCNVIELGSGRGEKEPRNVRIAHNHFENAFNNIKIFRPEINKDGFEFVDNTCHWADGSSTELSGFSVIEKAQDWKQEERNRVLNALMNIGPEWYQGNRENLAYIRNQY